MPINNPYHEGELAVQQRLQQVDIAKRNSFSIKNTIVAGAFRFIEQQSMLIIGSVNADGSVWSSIVTGQSGFMRVLNNQQIELSKSKLYLQKSDPLWHNIQQNTNIGLLIIELSSRRRLRISGNITNSSNGYIIDVKRAYPNCPKYIQRRNLRIGKSRQIENSIVQRDTLTSTQTKLISNADTLFVASAHPEHGVDASHRGGRPGFVKIIDKRQLIIPDFVGNSMFNTLGNILSNPHAGLTFIDFAGNSVLQLIGKAEILWEQDDPEEISGGTGRFWKFHIDAYLENMLPIEMRWEFMDSSPHIP